MQIELKVKHKDKKQSIGIRGDLQSADTFLVVGPGFCGYGESLKAAKENCIKAGCPKKAEMKAYLGDNKLGVDGFGQVSANKVLFCLGAI